MPRARTTPTVDELEGLVRAKGAVPIARLGGPRRPGRDRGELLRALGARGLEVTARFVRVPLAAQLSRLLSERGAPVPTAELRRGLLGHGGAAELGALLREEARRGAVGLVMRGGKEHVALPGPELLAPEEVAALATDAAQLTKALRALRVRPGRPRRTLHRADLARPADGVDALVLGAVGELAAEAGPLVFVPALYDRLAAKVAGSLVALAAAGRLELRPEASVGLLSAADAARCPRGADGAPLSYVRATPR